MKKILIKNCREKGGFTLMELLVYMALVGVIVVIAGQVFSDSTKFRVRSEGMIKSNAIASDVSFFMLDDIGQTGAKSAKDAAAESFSTKDSLYMDPTVGTKDSSSFRISKSCNTCNTDTLTVRRVRYDDDGHFKAVEQVQWFTVGKKLFRSCRIVPNTSSTASTDCPDESTDYEPVEVADHIDTFKVIPAKPRVLSTDTKSAAALSYLLPSTDASVKEFRLVPRYGEGNFELVSVTPPAGGTSVTLSGFVANYDFDINEPITTGQKANQVFVAASDGTTGTWKTLCKKVTLEPQVEYEISFVAPYAETNSRMFCPGRDYAAVGFRTQDGAMIAGLDDFNFFMPASSNETSERKFRFTVKTQAADVCMAFTFASYSPVAATGQLSLSEVALKKVESSNFDFEEENYTPRAEDKKNVKALLLKVVATRNGEGSSIRQVIPIPSNGPRD